MGASGWVEIEVGLAGPCTADVKPVWRSVTTVAGSKFKGRVVSGILSVVSNTIRGHDRVTRREKVLVRRRVRCMAMLYTVSSQVIRLTGSEAFLLQGLCNA